MKFLIKLFCLLSLVSSFAFSTEVFFFSTKDADNYLKKSNVKFLANNKYVMFDRPDDPGHVYVDRVYSYDTYFYAGSLRGYFWNNQTGDVYYISNDVKTNYFLDKGHWGTFTYAYEYSGTYNSNAVFLTYVSIYEFHKTNVAVCNVGEEFNTETMQCVAGCPAGQLWNVNTNSCVVDCSDEDNHKFFTSDYKCIDCSSALTADDIASCYCTGLGSSYNPGYFWDPDKPNILRAHCSNETEISFKFDKDKMKDKDNNSTNSIDKDKENPKPDKDKDNPNPDKKDNNENSNNSSGESGNSSNNNSGGSAGNGSSGGGGTGVETKPNPNYNGNGKEDGKGDGKEDSKGEEGKGDDAVAQKLDYGDLEKDSDKFNSDFKDALDSVISQAQDFKNSLNDTISKIKEGGLAKFNQSAIPNTCPLTYNVDFSYFRKDITFDICKVIAPASQTLYYFFYVVFFVLFLIVTIKLFLFTF